MRKPEAENSRPSEIEQVMLRARHEFMEKAQPVLTPKRMADIRTGTVFSADYAGTTES